MNWKYTQLSLTLSGLFPQQEEIVSLLIRAGLAPGMFSLNGTAYTVFTLVISKLEAQGRVATLADAALQLYPDNEIIWNARHDIPDASKSVYDGVVPAAGSMTAERYEVVTGKQKTFLPISFLEKGLIVSRAVAKIVTPDGMGSGFLISGNNLLITNHHVISKAPVPGCKAIFNYQATVNGLATEHKEYEISDAVFYTSKDHDWTVVRIEGDPAAVHGHIDLVRTSVKAEDFVNIIQHPGGGPKQVAMYHNVVTDITEHKIQYLTDTQPGSSGSPVFNSAWEVVALHNSGGWAAIHKGSKVICNAGITINCILDDLHEKIPDLLTR